MPTDGIVPCMVNRNKHAFRSGRMKLGVSGANLREDVPALC